MFNFLFKLIFQLKKPKIIVVAGSGKETTLDAISNVLGQYFKVRKPDAEFVILPWKPEAKEILSFFGKHSQLPVLVVTAVGEIPPTQDFFTGEKEKVREIIEFAKTLPAQGYLVLNFDDETVREIDDLTNLHTLTFGFQKGADFQASDVRLNGGTNFKINYKGSIVPVWLEKLFGKEQIYAALASAACGEIFDLNLVQISQALKTYQGLAGRMKLLKGIKNSWILDSAENTSVSSVIEALEILRKIEGGRKIAVLGDVVGIGKYTIEAHETIGEKIATSCDLLFTIGARAKFIAEGALRKGLLEEKIFQYDEVNEAKFALQKELKEGDLILIAGSKEMKMEKIIEEIKNFTQKELTYPKR